MPSAPSESTDRPLLLGFAAFPGETFVDPALQKYLDSLEDSISEGSQGPQPPAPEQPEPA